MKYIALSSLILLVACVGEEEKDYPHIEKSQHLEMDDTTRQNEVFESDPNEYRRSEPGKSKFSSPQISKNDYWLYRMDTVYLYETYDMIDSTQKGYVLQGDHVIYIDHDDSFIINAEGFVGNPMKVRLDNGTEGWVWDHYLVQMPHPLASKNGGSREIKSYFYNNLYAAPSDSVIFEGKKTPGDIGPTESDYSLEFYSYERNISYSKSESYESGEEEIRLPHVSIYKGYLFLDAWASGIELIDHTNGLPQSDRGEFEHNGYDEGSWEADISFDEMFTIVQRINFFVGEGCGNWYTIERWEEGCKLSIGGGC